MIRIVMRGYNSPLFIARTKNKKMVAWFEKPFALGYNIGPGLNLYLGWLIIACRNIKVQWLRDLLNLIPRKKKNCFGLWIWK